MLAFDFVMKFNRIVFSACSQLFLLQCLTCYGAESIQRQIESNHVTFDKNVTSPDRRWELSMQSDGDETYSLVISGGKTNKKIDYSPKPDFRICWSKDVNYMVIVRPIGFTTMVRVYSLNKVPGEAVEIFASEKVNQRKFVDYSLQRWDLKQGFVVFNIYENPRYLEGRKRRLLATEYVYFDGQNSY